MKLVRRFLAWLLGNNGRQTNPETTEMGLAFLPTKEDYAESEFTHAERLLQSIRPLLAREELERQLSKIQDEYFSYTFPNSAALLNGEFEFRWDLQGKAGREFDSVDVTVEHEGMFIVIAGTSIDSPVFLYTCAHRTTPINLKIQSLLYASAEQSLSIWIKSPNPFNVKSVSVKLRLSPDTINKWRERQLETEGFAGSIPHPQSGAAADFLRETSRSYSLMRYSSHEGKRDSIQAIRNGPRALHTV